MAHYAKVINGIVDEVIVIESEDLYKYLDNNLIHQLNPGQWVQTSYNTRGGVKYDPQTNEPSIDQSQALRGNFAGEGFHYDEDLDVFYCPKMYASWTLNTTTYTWEAPEAKPNGNYRWNEDTLAWVEAEEVA